MTNKIYLLEMLVMMLVFGIAVVGCNNDTTDREIDTALNGTWIDEYGWELRFNNGYYQEFNIPNGEIARGTYTAIFGKISLKLTHVTGLEFELENKLYTKKEAVDAGLLSDKEWDEKYYRTVRYNSPNTMLAIWWREGEESFIYVKK